MRPFRGHDPPPVAWRVRETRARAGPSEVGGTGLEPVTPSLSTRSGRSLRFADVRSGRNVERNRLASELFCEPERTSSVAIVATAPASSRSSRVAAQRTRTHRFSSRSSNRVRRFDSSPGRPGGRAAPTAPRAGRRAPPAPGGDHPGTAGARACGRSGARSPRPSSGSGRESGKSPGSSVPPP
jgi:hypothetical protein